MHEPSSLWVVIDPMQAFTDDAGTLATAYGNHELVNIKATVQMLRQHISRRSVADQWLWVRSEYETGQHSDDSANNSLATLCDGSNPVDALWDTALIPPTEASVITKTKTDATTSLEFRDVIEKARSGPLRTIHLTGFLLTSCVRDTALSIATMMADTPTRVVVHADLVAARSSNYSPDESGLSRVDRTLQQLATAGIAITASK